MRGNPSIEKNHAYLLIYLHTHNKPDPNYFWPRVPAVNSTTTQCFIEIIQELRFLRDTVLKIPRGEVSWPNLC